MRDDRGFTLIEVMISLVILSVVLLGHAAVTGGLVVQVSKSGKLQEAIELAHNRLARIQLDPVYDSLEVRYAVSDDTVPGHPGFKVSTVFAQIGGPGQTTDHKVITVHVIAPGRSETVSRSMTVAAP